ncbi:MAG: hypothetical protein AAB415_02650 [Patescibacteria group bacterium]
MEQTDNTFEALVPPKRSSSAPLVIIILIILAVVLGWWFLSGRSQGGLSTSGAMGDYQAVFLTNNQVYFGRLTETSDDYVTLTDIFYLQVNQPLQPAPSAGGAIAAPTPNVNLIKLGAELHGPTDWMKINREHILFIENLRDEPESKSQVLEGIRKYQAEQAIKP